MLWRCVTSCNVEFGVSRVRLRERSGGGRAWSGGRDALDEQPKVGGENTIVQGDFGSRCGCVGEGSQGGEEKSLVLHIDSGVGLVVVVVGSLVGCCPEVVSVCCMLKVSFSWETPSLYVFLFGLEDCIIALTMPIPVLDLSYRGVHGIGD